MRATIKALHPDTIEMSMTISMPLSEWKKLRSQINESDPTGVSVQWPLCDFLRNTDAVIREAEKHFETMEDRRRG